MQDFPSEKMELMKAFRAPSGIPPIRPMLPFQDWFQNFNQFVEVRLFEVFHLFHHKDPAIPGKISKF